MYLDWKRCLSSIYSHADNNFIVIIPLAATYFQPLDAYKRFMTIGLPTFHPPISIPKTLELEIHSYGKPCYILESHSIGTVNSIVIQEYMNTLYVNA